MTVTGLTGGAMGHVVYPPGRGFLRLPASPNGFRAGLALWGACRPLARGGRFLSHHLVRWAPSGWLRRRSDGGAFVASIDERLELLARLPEWFGPVDEVAFYVTPQAERGGLAILALRRGKGVGFVKVRPGTGFGREVQLATALQEARTFQVPLPISHGRSGRDAFLAMRAILAPRHSPRPGGSVRAITSEFSRLLRGLERPFGVPAHWTAMHGDLGPWNLRGLRGQRPVVFDLEQVAYGPPGADLVFHAAASRALRVLPVARPRAGDEAISFWRATIPRRFGTRRQDVVLARRMLDVLSDWQGSW